MLPNGSGGTGRSIHSCGFLSWSGEALKLSNRSANLRTRRAGNGISMGDRVCCKGVAATFVYCDGRQFASRVRDRHIGIPNRVCERVE